MLSVGNVHGRYDAFNATLSGARKFDGSNVPRIDVVDCTGSEIVIHSQLLDALIVVDRKGILRGLEMTNLLLIFVGYHRGSSA